MNSQFGKMRNVYGELQQQKFENVKSTDTTSEGFLADANNRFLAVIFFLKIIYFRFHGQQAEEELLLF